MSDADAEAAPVGPCTGGEFDPPRDPELDVCAPGARTDVCGRRRGRRPAGRGSHGSARWVGPVSRGQPTRSSGPDVSTERRRPCAPCGCGKLVRATGDRAAPRDTNAQSECAYSAGETYDPPPARHTTAGSFTGHGNRDPRPSMAGERCTARPPTVRQAQRTHHIVRRQLARRLPACAPPR